MKQERKRENGGEREKECLPLLGSDYIILGLGRTRHSFKLTNQFPNLLQADVRPSP